MLKRFYEKYLARAGYWVAWQATRQLRKRLKNVRFIGITGSCGKTTTKELTAAVLNARLTGVRTPESWNGLFSRFKTMMRVRPDHDYCLMEMAVGREGDMATAVKIFPPDIAVVLNIGTDHFSEFRGMEGVAREKGTLVEALPASGTAILNADDPLVMAMATRTGAKIFTFGRSPQAMLRAEDVRSAFPAPVEFLVIHGEERVRVKSKLYGEHQVHNILAALATGLVAGLSLSEAAGAIAEVAPFRARLEVAQDGHGVTFVQDTWKASMSSMGPALALMKGATIPRRWIVMGTLSDYSGSGGDRYRKIAKQCLESADFVLFVGLLAPSAVKANNPDGKLLKAFATVREANDFLSAHLEPGDLVLLKGSGTVDHFERLLIARQQSISCWREKCGRFDHCSACKFIHREP